MRINTYTYIYVKYGMAGVVCVGASAWKMTLSSKILRRCNYPTAEMSCLEKITVAGEHGRSDGFRKSLQHR